MQRLDAESAEPLVVGPGHQVLPRMTSDGQWVLFQEPVGAEGSRIMRVPLAGGRPEQVLATTRVAWPRCAVRGRCVLFEQDKDRWIISSLDPVRGKGERLCSIPFNTQRRGPFPRRKRRGTRCRRRSSDEPHSDLLAAWRAAERRRGGERHRSRKSRLGRHRGRFFLHRDRTPSGRELLFIRLDGTSRVLWSQPGTPVAAIPSPDGTHLAIAGWTRQSNVWMLTDSF